MEELFDDLWYFSSENVKRNIGVFSFSKKNLGFHCSKQSEI